jgi:uncharacterized membrane protein YkgB
VVTYLSGPPRTPQETDLDDHVLSPKGPLHRVLDRINSRAVGGAVVRSGLAGVIGWIGLVKFTDVEDEAIRPILGHSPLMSRASTAAGVRPLSNLLGVAEVTIAVLIAQRPVVARASALGSARAAGMFATTLSFLLTTPGSRSRRWVASRRSRCSRATT